MVDGIGSMSRSMFGIVGLDGTNTSYSQLNWNTVTKGKRSRKSVTRNGRSKLGSESPKREGEFSGSDTDRFDEPPLADGLGCVPIKKRRHLLHSPSPSQNTELLSPQQQTPSSHSEDYEHFSDNNGFSSNQSSDSFSNLHRLTGGVGKSSDDGGVGDKVSVDTDNLSGIALLAAAACFDTMDDNPDTVKGDVTEVSSTFRKHDDTCTLTMPLGESISCSESEYVYQKGLSELGYDKPLSFADDSSGHVLDKNKLGVASASITLKVERLHWDLNTTMEAWEEPQEDLAAGTNSAAEASTDGMQKEKLGIQDACSTQLDARNNRNNVNHMSVNPIDVDTALFESKVVNAHEVSVCQVEDSENVVGSTLPRNLEQQMVLPEVAGLEMSRSENNFQMKDAETSQKTSELSENGTVLVKEMLGRTFKTVDVGSSGSAEDHSQSLGKHEDMSTSEIPTVGQPAVCSDGKGQEDKAFVADAIGIKDALDHGSKDLISQHDNHLVSMVDVVKTLILQDSVKTLVDDDHHEECVPEDEDHGRSDATQNISELQVDYDSPYEDGELRGPALYSWHRNENDDGETECVDYESDGRVGEESDAGDHPGSEIVEAGSEGSQATEKKHLFAAQVSETVSRKSILGVKKGMEENTAKIETEAKKGSNQVPGTTDELSTPIVRKNDVGMRRRHSFDHADINDIKGSYLGEVGSKITREKLHSRVEGSSPVNMASRKEAIYSSQRSSKVGDCLSRSERSSSADRSVTRYRSTLNGQQQFERYRNSTHRYKCRGTEDHQQTGTRNKVTNSADKFDDVNSYGNNQPLNFSSKGIQRPFFPRRSSVERDDYYTDHRRFTNINRYRRGTSGNFTGGIGRGLREEYDEPDDDDAVSPGRFPRYLSQGDRSFSPGRVPHVYDPCWRSRSRSRTRSPRAWQSQRERNLITRRHSRSPEFRSESSFERMRVPFHKQNFTADYGESFILPPKDRFSPTHNNRWANEGNFANRSRHRRSPIGVFRQSQRVDPVGLSGRLKSDDRFRTDARPGRYGEGDKLEENYGDRKHDERLGVVDHRHSETSAILRRPRHDTLVTFEDDNSSNRWVDERNFANPLRHRRSPTGSFRRSGRVDPVGLSGRLKSDDHFRPVAGSGRYSEGDKLEETCGDGKHEERLGMVARSARHSETSSILRRPRHDTHVSFEDDNSNNEDDRDKPKRNISSFSADYGENFLSPTRGRISPRNSRWVDESNFDNGPSRRRRSSPGMFRWTQRLKPDDYFRTVARPGRFTDMGGDDWGNDTRIESRRNLE